MKERGKVHLREDGVRVLATVHPAWVLRQPERSARAAAYVLLRDDLALLAPRQSGSSD